MGSQERPKISSRLPIRALYLTEQLSLEEERPLIFNPLMPHSLPSELESLTGVIRSARLLKQDGCSLPFLIQAERGVFVLKVARDGYRSQELWAEHTTMWLLHNGPVPVPQSLAHTRSGDLSFQLREYSPGEPLSDALKTDKSLRPEAVRQMGRLLASIHSQGQAEAWTWEEWIDASLEQAGRNTEAGVCDPHEFTQDQPPNAALGWLLANRPAGDGSVCLLHGDYRPKNILWENGRITSVIDWQFVDVGDPYYDLSIIHWYMRDEAEWRKFVEAYGLQELDQERLNYCMMLQKFLNV